jgi:PAS domain S-box-containing protein
LAEEERPKPGRLRAEEGALSSAGGQPLAITYAEKLDDGRTLSISPEVEPVLGYTQEEWMADPLLWVKLLHPDDRDRIVQECAAANQAQERFRADYRMIARDGRLVWIHDEASIVYGHQGHPLCWQGVMVVVERSVE